VPSIYQSVCVLLVGFILSVQVGCDPVPVAIGDIQSGTRGSNDEDQDTELSGVVQTNTSVVSPQNSPNLIVGSFNIQTFGVTKMSKPHVVDVLVDIARKFDILAVQELRDGDERVAKEFLEILNSDGSQYAASVGPKQGYFIKGKLSRYFEQAIYFYDTTKVEMIDEPFVADDPYEVNNRPPMHRPPYVGYFRCKNLPPQKAFTFVLLNVHIDPDDAHEEFESMRDVMMGVYGKYPNEDDFILLGDLNDEPDKYQQYGWMLQQYSAIPSVWKTNTRLTECYDNLIFDAGFTAEFSGEAGVLNLMSEYSLTKEKALEVSDHMPVWATFSLREATQAAVVQDPSDGVIR
jgi:endonuclease/exonuclease/phosphatase family metal-dependent hydrolase